MSQWTPETSYDEFLTHEDVIRAAIGTNEATTRVRAINTMLFDVLGWDKRIVDEEKYCRAEGFADYAFSDGTSLSLILEAKKDGTTFVLPDVEIPAAPIGFPLLAKESPDAEKALRQALGYAAGEGARYIAITNGHQWLLTLTFVHNQSVAQRSVYVFESLDAIKDKKFRLFWQCFSPSAINGNVPANGLLESRKKPAPPKLSTNITNYPLPASRNVIANEMYAATAAVWNEVKNDEADPEFLRECYVEPEASSASLVLAEEMVQQRLSVDEALTAQAVQLDGVANIIGDDLPEKPIVVLGKVGHGKTTFLRYLREFKAKTVLANYIQLDINFVDRPDRPEDVGQFIYDEIERQLLETYQTDIIADNLVRGFLHIDIERFKRSYEGRQYPEGSDEYKAAERGFILEIRNNRHVYLGKVFAHLKRGRIKGGSGHSIAVFLDNLDRRIDTIQEEAFLRASAMARDWSALVFVCLRPGTFYRSTHFGVLDSVAPKVINVTSPPTRELVPKRLRYAQRVASGISDSSRAKTGASFGRNVSLNLPRVANFLEACAWSFDRSRDLCDFFDAVANGNARDMLTSVLQVLTSLHLNTQKILALKNPASYIMPVHEALRAMLFGDFIQFDPEQSAFINLFDISRADPMEHFTRLLVLGQLSRVPRSHPTYGYLPVGELERFMVQLGYSEEHVAETTRFLFEKGYVESKMPRDKWTRDMSPLRVTSRGIYSARKLVSEFTYIDAVVIDTPIIDDSFRRRIHDELAIGARLARAEVFLEYLDACSHAIQDSAATGEWLSVSRSVRSHIKDIRERLR